MQFQTNGHLVKESRLQDPDTYPVIFEVDIFDSHRRQFALAAERVEPEGDRGAIARVVSSIEQPRELLDGEDVVRPGHDLRSAPSADRLPLHGGVLPSPRELAEHLDVGQVVPDGVRMNARRLPAGHVAVDVDRRDVLDPQAAIPSESRVIGMELPPSFDVRCHVK